MNTCLALNTCPTSDANTRLATNGGIPVAGPIPVHARIPMSDTVDPRELGQASVEYALVLLAAAIVATVLISWATKTNLLDALFDHVMQLIQGKAA